MEWRELRIAAGREAVDLLAYHLVRMGSGGVLIEGQASQPAGWVTLAVYFPADQRYSRRERRVRELAAKLAREGWPVDPSGVSTRPLAEKAIIIDPGMAFGTGTHPTTGMCLSLLEEHLRGGETVIDLGTGSGILAIAAARLGAARVVALDIDPVAVEIARRNVARNGVENIVEVRPSGRGAFAFGADLVVANITASAISRASPRVAAALRRGGHFIASGIVRERRTQVERAMVAAGLLLIGDREESGWVSLVAVKG